MGSYDDRKKANTNWVMALFESREIAREHKIRAEAAVNPHTCFYWDPIEGELDVPAHTSAHAAIMNYYTDLLPYAEHVPTLWKETLVTVDRPIQGQEIQAGYGDYFGDVDFRGLSFKQRSIPVSLNRLGTDWRNETLNAAVTYRDADTHEKQSKEVQAKLLLPVTAISEVYDQLNRSLKKLNLSAEIDELSSVDEPPEPPDHVANRASSIIGTDNSMLDTEEVADGS